MALLKFPDKLVEKLKCSECKLYLSMAPVCIKQDGQTVCSRCVNQSIGSASRVISRCYIYEEIAGLHAFPCQYQTFGCPRYIKFNQTEEHETGCMYRTFSCPANIHSSCDWKDSVFMLCQHYEAEHPELYLKDPNFEFNINADEEVYRLVKIDDILLLLQTKCAPKDDKMWFNAVYFGSPTNASLIRYSVKLSGEDTKHMIQLENENPCPTTHMQLIPEQSLEVNINAVLALLKLPKIIQSQWVITIPEELKKNLNDQNSQDEKKLLCITNELIKCPYCRIFMTPPIFRCLNGHVTCIVCKGFNNECIDCQLNNVKFTRNYDLEHLAKLARFYCKWKNCEKFFRYDEIRIHELNCLERVYKCPCCEVRIGLLSEVPKHFQQKHIDIQFINESLPCHVIELDIKDKDLYILLEKEFVRLRLVRYNTAGHFYVKLIITHYISKLFCHYLKCELVNNRKGFEYNFNGSVNPHIVTEHISKEQYGDGTGYFTVRLSISENTWIPFDYPFKSVKIEN